MMADHHFDDPEEFFRSVDNDSAKPPHPNGHDHPHSCSLPAIDQADVGRWRGVEPPEIVFSIEDLVPEGMVTLETGAGGAGKTLTLQMAGTAIAANLGRFLGKHAVSGAAAGLFAEDPDAVLHVRQPRINAALGIDYDNIAGRYFPRSYFGIPAQLWRDGRSTQFFAELEDSLARIDNLRLLTLDNAAVLYAGDENSRPEVTAFISALNGLADRLAIAIILSAHPSKSQDGSPLRVTSGSTAWVNACRSVLELRPGDENEGPSLKVVKANHAATGITIPLEWRDKVLAYAGPATGIIGSIERRTCERVFMDLLDKVIAEKQPVSSASRAGNFAPRLFATRPDRERFARADFERAMQSLFASKQIINVPYGRKGDERTRLSRAGEPSA